MVIGVPLHDCCRRNPRLASIASGSAPRSARRSSRHLDGELVFDLARGADAGLVSTGVFAVRLPRNSCCPSCRRGRLLIQSKTSSAGHAMVVLRPPAGPSSNGSGKPSFFIQPHSVESEVPPSSSFSCGLNIRCWPGLSGALRNGLVVLGLLDRLHTQKSK